MNSNTSELPQVQPSTRQNCPMQSGNPNRDKGQKNQPCNQTRQSREIKQVKPLHCPSHKQQFCPLLLCIHTSWEKRRKKCRGGGGGGEGEGKGKAQFGLENRPCGQRMHAQPWTGPANPIKKGGRRRERAEKTEKTPSLHSVLRKRARGVGTLAKTNSRSGPSKIC